MLSEPQKLLFGKIIRICFAMVDLIFCIPHLYKWLYSAMHKGIMISYEN